MPTFLIKWVWGCTQNYLNFCSLFCRFRVWFHDDEVLNKYIYHYHNHKVELLLDEKFTRLKLQCYIIVLRQCYLFGLNICLQSIFRGRYCSLQVQLLPAKFWPVQLSPKFCIMVVNSNESKNSQDQYCGGYFIYFYLDP